MFDGRTKPNDGKLKVSHSAATTSPTRGTSRRTTRQKPVRYMIDPERRGKVAVIVMTNPKTGK
jgi:hypothetical protein